MSIYINVVFNVPVVFSLGWMGFSRLHIVRGYALFNRFAVCFICLVVMLYMGQIYNCCLGYGCVSGTGLQCTVIV